MTHRFVVGPDLALTPDQSRQIASVLRLAPGDVVTLVHAGEEHDLVLGSVTPSRVSGTITARRHSETEPAVTLTLALPLLRGEHAELVLESATQLGVARFVPFVSARSIVRELGPARLARWERIVREAVETSRRGRVPEIAPVVPWQRLFDVLAPPAVVAWEGEREVRLRDALRTASGDVALVVGPEGGLSDDEVAYARSRGAAVVSLGRRTLRAETAAIAAVAQVLALLEAG